MELRQLKYFVTVARTLNFSEASRSLFITQGTLSQQIMQLEDELGAILFSRTSRSVSLTTEGMELLPLAEKTLEGAEDCRARMRDMRKTLTGNLRVGVTWSFKNLVTDAVKAFMKANPGVQIKITCNTASELHRLLHSRELDLIVAFKPIEEDPDEDSEALLESRLSVIMSKDNPMAGKEVIEVEELEGKGLILPNGGLQAQKEFISFMRVNPGKLNVRAELNDPDMILDLVQGTMLVSVMSSYELHDRPTLVAVPLAGIQKEMPGCVHTLRGTYLKRSAKVLTSFLREFAAVENACRKAIGN